MLYRIGRFLQLVGMILLPVAIAGNVVDPQAVPLWTSLSISAVGVLVFGLGWLLQQFGRPK